jgi:hypothetical protein
MSHVTAPRRVIQWSLVLVGLWCAGTPLGARQFPAPPGWKWITDSEAKLTSTLDLADGQWLFGTMAPGWHITTRPAVTLFEPTTVARGRYVVESETFLFPGESAAGFGNFVGGQDLETRARYLAFLIRRDGSVAVEAVDGSRRTMLAPWTKAAAVQPGAASGDPVRNTLRLEGEPSAIAFMVNGTKVAEVPRASSSDGIVGLRIGDRLNLHVTSLDVTHRLALPRPVKTP